MNMNYLKPVYKIDIFENGKYSYTLPVVFDTIEQRNMYMKLYSIHERAELANQQIVFGYMDYYRYKNDERK